jgi:arylsulfatase A-like enzyme
VDIFPTLAGLCELEPPGELDGASLQGLLEDPLGPAPRAGAISVVIRQVDGMKGKGFSGIELQLEKDAGSARRILGRALNTVEWSYMEWDGGNLGVELYDAANDPHELNNLADDSEYASVMAELHALIGKLDHTADQ